MRHSTSRPLSQVRSFSSALVGVHLVDPSSTPISRPSVSSRAASVCVLGKGPPFSLAPLVSPRPLLVLVPLSCCVSSATRHRPLPPPFPPSSLSLLLCRWCPSASLLCPVWSRPVHHSSSGINNWVYLSNYSYRCYFSNQLYLKSYSCGRCDWPSLTLGVVLLSCYS